MTGLLCRFDEVPALKAQLGSLAALSAAIGEKSANLSEIASLGITIPSGVILTSDAYKAFVENGSVDIPDDLWDDFLQLLKQIEESQNLKYGSPKTPLLLSVRGDASKYMVGMLDSVAHIGLNDLTARALERSSLNRAYVWDCYRRLVQGYGIVVLKIAEAEFEFELERFKKARRLEMWSAFSALDFIELTKINKAIIVKKTGRPFPQDPFEQLRKIMTAVFASVNGERAELFRKMLGIGEVSGALTVMPMVFGNNGIGSSAAVSVSRDLVTGEAKINGEYSVNATCDDVSSGSRNPLTFETLVKENSSLHREIVEITKSVEKHFRYPVILDFVVNEGKVYCLEAVKAQLTAAGRFKAAKDMVGEEIIEKKDGLTEIEPGDLTQMMSPHLAGEVKDLLCKGVCGGRECIVGKICLTAEDVSAAKKEGVPAVYVKNSLIPADFETFLDASAIVTTAGSNVSFAAAISRLFRRTAALGCDGLEIDYEEKQIICKGKKIAAGEKITVTGCGCLLEGEQELKSPETLDDINAKEVLEWADDIRKDQVFVFTTAEDAREVKLSVDVESDGVGLFTIEKFFEDEHSQIITNLAKGFSEEAVSAFEKHLTEKLTDIFEAGGTKAVTVRLFEPNFDKYVQCPLGLAHEIGELRAQEGTEAEVEEKRNVLNELKSQKRLNGLIGCRAVRACLVHPEFMKAQFNAILGAAKAAKGKGGDPKVRIVVPFVTEANEMKQLIKAFDAVAIEVGEKAQIGAQIETPRACLTSGKIANACDFIDISVSLLSELTYGMSRADAPQKLLARYNEKQILKEGLLDRMEMETVGLLMKKCVSTAREAKKEGQVGIFSEDFANPAALKWYTELGVNSFICRPPAVPVARLCAAKTLLARE